MRKILSTLMASCIALLSSSTAVLAVVNDNYEVIKSIADTAAENYLAFSAGNPELDNWDYLEIDHSYPIYDFNDNIDGFVYELTGTNKQGFILVSNHNEQMKVTRASAYNSFEYIEELEDGETLYGVNTRTFYTKEENEFTDLSTGNSVSVNNYESKELSLVSSRSSIAQVGGNTYYFIDNYNYISNLEQPNNVSCVATSATMLLMYYYNSGETEVMWTESTESGLLYELRYNYIGQSRVHPSEYKTGLTDWLEGAGYSNIDIDYYIGDSPDNEWEPNYDTLDDDEIDSLLVEIQQDRPVIVMVGERSYGDIQVDDEPVPDNVNQYNGLGISLHAMVTYGVKQYGETYYLISKDPLNNNNTDGTGARIEESIWYTEDDHPTYFAIYAVIYTSFS